MKYKDLIQFDPVDDIIKFSKLGNVNYKEKIVKTFVCSDSYINYVLPTAVNNLSLESTEETKGLQVVGNYGTGKSHLMSLISTIAEDASYLPMLKDERARHILESIAGKYQVRSFELGSTSELWTLICNQIDIALRGWGIDYSISNDNAPDMYTDKLERMMAVFEEAFPDKGFLIVIDEMLSYLRGRSQPDKINSDLPVLQALGQLSDRTHFRIIFGVQELIYQIPEFLFAADMLSKVNERYADLSIQKEDVQYIVHERLLQKDEHQKQWIREHLQQFVQLFPDINNKLETYVSLYPVHPSYFDNFSQIRIGKSQREILSTLTHKFRDIADEDIPQDNPGLVCYDSYWHDILRNQDLRALPDVNRVAQIAEDINQKIETNFTGPLYSKKKDLAHRIVAAIAIKTLQNSLSAQNGSTAKTLVTDLCPIDSMCTNYDELVDMEMTVVADQIVNTTIGQFFEKNETNEEYHFRMEGGVNFEQVIASYADNMSNGLKDEYFFQFLAEVLPVEGETYRTGFRIWQHHITWLSHNCEREGYIFMGNPQAKSTTQPKQHFYIYFMPLFDSTSHYQKPLDDEVCIWLDKLNEDFRRAVTLYGAALTQENVASSDQKPNYSNIRRQYFNRVRDIFNRQFMDAAEVEYRDQRMPLRTMQGADRVESKIQTIDGVVEYIMDAQFSRENNLYPKFTALAAPYGKGNRDTMIKAAKETIIQPDVYNKSGVAMLTALGLFQNGRLDTTQSPYAQNIRALLDQAGEGHVVNRNDILEPFYENMFQTKDTHIEAELEFLVLATMVAMGEIELTLSGGVQLTALKLDMIRTIPSSESANFTHISKPRSMNTAAVKELFIQLTGHDLTNQLSEQATFVELCTKAQSLAQTAAKMESAVLNGITVAGVEIVSADEGLMLSNDLRKLKEKCDMVQRFNTQVKMRNMPWSVQEIRATFEVTRKKMQEIDGMILIMRQLEQEVGYLKQAINLTSDTQLLQDITSVINRIPTMLQASEQTRAQFNREIQQAKQKFAQWYISCYTRAHISQADNQKKIAIKQSKEAVVCEALAAAGTVNYAAYAAWEREMNRLVPADPSVTLESVLVSLYNEFNPRTDITPRKSLDTLHDEIIELYRDNCKQIHEMVNDDGLTQNMDMLLSQQKSLLHELQTNAVEITGSNVNAVIQMLSKLMESFERVEIDHQMIMSKFPVPITIQGAKTFLNDLIDAQCRGLNPNKVRIIFK